MKKIVALVLTFALLVMPSFAVDQTENDSIEVSEEGLAAAENGVRL